MPYEHYCHCGEWGSHGFGKTDADRKWFCEAHRPDWIPLTERIKRHRITCQICGNNIEDPTAPGIHVWTSGWVMQRKGGGGHSLSLPKRHPYWAHKDCVERKIKGWIGQGVLFEPEEGGP